MERLPSAPFRAWILDRVTEYGTLEALNTRVGHDLTKHARGAYSTVQVDVVDSVLAAAGVHLSTVYPELYEVVDGPEAFCFACRAFTPLVEGACSWCDRPVERVDVSHLPSREALEQIARENPDPPPLVVRHKPRHKMPPRPLYFDVRLDLRRTALEAMANGSGWLVAARLVWKGAWASPEACARSLAKLCEREGWHTFGTTKGGSARTKAARLRKTRANIRQALADGTWDRTVEQQPAPSQRKILDERLVRDAAWLYFYDELSFMQIAERLFARSTAANPKGLKAALIDEWNRHGWPRRTVKAANRGWQRPPRSAQCIGKNRDGSRCQKWAKKDKRLCQGHDRAAAEQRRELATRASRQAYADAVPVAPFAWWVRQRAQELGSLMAFYRRVEDAISYWTLQGWAQMWGHAEPGKGKRHNSRVVRRSTVDRILEAWGDGTTFEDIYLPVDDDVARAA